MPWTEYTLAVDTFHPGDCRLRRALPRNLRLPPETRQHIHPVHRQAPQVASAFLYLLPACGNQSCVNPSPRRNSIHILPTDDTVVPRIPILRIPSVGPLNP